MFSSTIFIVSSFTFRFIIYFEFFFFAYGLEFTFLQMDIQLLKRLSFPTELSLPFVKNH